MKTKKALYGTLAAAAFVLGLGFGVPAVASATSSTPHKVFVCKYVGTPGENERLQTGQNPIDVDIHAIPDGAHVGAFFADAQGRSFVLAFDTGQDEPDVSECPQGDGGTTTTTQPGNDDGSTTTTTEGSTTTTTEGEGTTTTTVVIGGHSVCSAVITPNPVHVGESGTITLSGFTAGETIDIAIDSIPVDTEVVDEAGNLVINLGEAPEELADTTLTLTFSGQTSGTTCSTTLDILPAGTPGTLVIPPPTGNPDVVIPVSVQPVAVAPTAVQPVTVNPGFTG